MKRIILLLLTIFLVSACGTRHHKMDFVANQKAVPATAKYFVKPAEDNSGFVFDQDEEGIDIKVAMETALVDALKEEGLYAGTSRNAFAIKPVVQKYDPGNAFGRWLMPGVGSTLIEVSSEVSAPEGNAVGTIITKNTIDAGGAYVKSP